MNLIDLLHKMWEDRSTDSIDGLKNQARSEHYLEQAYSGRYLFELIQNGRDAAKSANQLGKVLIKLDDYGLSVSNTGAPFNEQGVRSVTLIGDSPKDTGDFIGFKGIGFKSIQEVSDRPMIVTAEGSIMFDKAKSFEKLSARFTSPKQLPLFFLPHYDPQKLSVEELTSGIVSKIILPFKPNTDIENTITVFSTQIDREQLLLLGSLETVEFDSPSYKVSYRITPKTSNKITVFKNGDPATYKLFIPKRRIRISEDILRTLSEKEAQIYGNDPYVAISLAFALDKNERLKVIPDCKLYLYFPLKISSGFEFIIHSHFIVDPQRATLRPSKFNEFIAKEIGHYLAVDWFREAKFDHAGNILNFLAFERNSDEPILGLLYNELVTCLKGQKFIYDNLSRSFLFKDEVIFATGVDKNLFPGNKLRGKTLIYIDNERTVNWLIKEFSIYRLQQKDIQENIEEECLRQVKLKNIKFFQHLYDYVTKNKDINLIGRKVLLTKQFELYSSTDDVFNGMDKSENVLLSKQILKKIHVLHEDIVISASRLVQERLGFIEFNTDALVRRLLNLYNIKGIPELDILKALVSINSSQLTQIRRRVKMPVSGPNGIAWLNPQTTPIYLPHRHILHLYPEGNFLELSLLNDDPMKNDKLLKKLVAYGAWETPAIFFNDNQRQINSGTTAYKTLNQLSGYSTPFYLLSGDWEIDIPNHINSWFSNAIMENWQSYKNIIESNDTVRYRYKSQQSDMQSLNRNSAFKTTSFYDFIVKYDWIIIDGKSRFINDIIAIGPTEKGQRISLLKQFFALLVIDLNLHGAFVNDTNLCHLDHNTFLNFQNILQLINRQYPTIETAGELFRKSYNVILNKLFDLYARSNQFQKEEILKFKKIPFLGRNDFSDTFRWDLAEHIYYIDNKNLFESYPLTLQKIIQPQFSTMDKNRFGQIARRIGINYKSTIKEELLPYTIVGEVPLTEFIRDFPQCLALLEAKSENPFVSVELAAKLAELKVNTCDSLTVQIVHAGSNVDYYYPPFKVVKDNSLTMVLITEIPIETENKFFAGLICGILDELQEKDFQQYEGSLIDFYFSSDKEGSLKRNLVDDFRVDEITEMLQEKTFNNRQIFWAGVLKLKITGTNHLAWITDEGIDIANLADMLDVSEVNVGSIDRVFNFDQLNNPANIKPLSLLLKLLQINFSDFISRTGLYMSFFVYYQHKFETLKVSLKSDFEKELYIYLKDKTVKDQETYAGYLLGYDRLPYTAKDDLNINIEKVLRQQVLKLIPKLKFSFVLKKGSTGYIATLYNRNFKNLLALVSRSEIPNEGLNSFLNGNRDRSLVYFNKSAELINRYRIWLSTRKMPNTSNNGNADMTPAIDLSAYTNDSNSQILTGKSIAVAFEKKPEKGGHNGFGGQRSVGGGNQANNDEVGLVAEKMVYDLLLKRKEKEVKWRSANAALAGVYPEGRDNLKYDMLYIDSQDSNQYVEVKGTSGDNYYFYISADELEFAKKEKENYHLIFVKQALDNFKREITDLGNPFVLTGGESLFQNGSYTAVFDTLKITFDL